jgi:hypothetical protein
MRLEDYSDIKDPSDWCPIEQRPFEDNEKVIILDCGHMFCEKPLIQWHKIKNICPLCKRQIHCEHDEVTQQLFLMYFGDDLNISSDHFEEVSEYIPLISTFLVYLLLLMVLLPFLLIYFF